MLTFATLEAALAVSALSVTVGRAHVTKPLREWTGKRVRWLGDLLSCPYCMSHWFALAVALTLPQAGVVGYLVNVLAIVALAALITGAALKLLHWDQTELQATRDALYAVEDSRDDLIKHLAEVVRDVSDA